MLNVFLGAPVVGILTALAAVVAEQLLAVIANIIFQREIVLDVYTHLGFFLVAAAIIEEILKYFSVSYILRRTFSLRRFKFIFAATIAGAFFGLTEIYFVLLANGRRVQDIKIMGGEVLFSLLTILLVHIATILLIAALISTRAQKTKLDALRTIAPAAFVHLLVNFLIIQKGDFTNWLIGIALGIVFIVNLSIIASNFQELD